MYSLSPFVIWRIPVNCLINVTECWFFLQSIYIYRVTQKTEPIYFWLKSLIFSGYEVDSVHEKSGLKYLPTCPEVRVYKIRLFCFIFVEVIKNFMGSVFFLVALYIYIYIYIFVCVCLHVCVCMCVCMYKKEKTIYLEDDFIIHIWLIR